MAWPWSAGEILTAANLEAATKPNNAVCQATKGAQNLNNNTPGVLAWAGADDVDPRGWHDPAVNNSRITPDIAGWYEATVYLDWEDAGDYARIQARLRQNGVTIVWTDEQFVNAAAGFSKEFTSTGPFVLMNGTTDYLEVIGTQVNGAAAARAVTGVWVVRLVSPT